MGNVHTEGTQITTLAVNDIIYIPRTSDNSDKWINKTDFDAYINSIVSASWTTVTIADGVTQGIALGAVASYEGFIVEAILGYSTNRAIITKKFTYENSIASAWIVPVSGTLNKSLINIEQAAVQAGQFNWKITNNSGSLLTIKYRITNQFPAI